MDEEISSQECYPLQMDHVPEYVYQIASKELHETPNTREVEMNKLKDLLSADILTTGIKFEEDFLHQFLRHRKYDSLKAFQYLQKYLTFRRNHSSLFLRIPDEIFDGNPSTEFFTALPYRSPDGCAIIVSQVGKWNPDVVSFDDFKKLVFLSFMQLLRCPMTQISGIKSIHDFKDTLKHMGYCTPQNLLLFYNAAFCCLPARYKEVHLVNKNVFMASAWAVIKHFITEKMRKRIFFHSNPEDLLNHFPSSILPTQYGGSLKNYHDPELLKRFSKDQGNFPEEGQPNFF